MIKKIKAKLSINRRSGSDGHCMVLNIEDVTSRIEFVEVELSMEDFGNAISGLSSIPVECEVRGLKLVGKKRENKVELVECHFPTFNKADNEKIVLAAAKHLEVDGWEASAYMALNTQGGRTFIQGTKSTYICKVSLSRFVDIPQEVAA